MARRSLLASSGERLGSIMIVALLLRRYGRQTYPMFPPTWQECLSLASFHVNATWGK